MATGYRDWVRLTYLAEQGALLYFQRVFLLLQPNVTITKQYLQVENEIFYAYQSFRVSDQGLVIVFGVIKVLGG